MKKLLRSAIVLLTCITSLDAQVVFYEDFDGIQGPTAGGAGTYVFPAGWLLCNVDNGTPSGSVSYINEAWERREDFAFNVADSAAFSTSWYSPTGTADDWMWTPMIGSLPANTVLSWNAVAYDAMYPDGYEVRIMTQSSTPGGPTGATGVMGNQLTNSTQIFTVPAENSSWTSRSVNLAAYAGESVWIGFRNNSTDKFLLLIDDIKVESVINYDASLTMASPFSEYSKIPLNQGPVLPLMATVNNAGVQAVTNVILTAKVYDATNSLVHTATSSSMASMASGASSVFTATPPFIPTAVDSYRVVYTVAIAETDEVPSNDMLSDSIDITDSVYARDMGTSVTQIGIGAGNGGNLGNTFVVTDTARLSSVSVYFNSSFSKFQTGVDIFNFNNGVPTTTLYASPADTIIGAFTGWHLFNLPANIILMPDTYVVAAREIDSTLTVGQTTDKFTNGTTWVNWPTSPFGGWKNMEAFGGSFSKSLMIRANLLDKCSNMVANVSSSQGPAICSGSSDTLNATGGNTYLWDGLVGSNSLIISPTSPQTYTVTAINQYTCRDTATITIGVNPLPVVTFAAGTDSLCSGDSTTLTGTSGLSYTWTGGVTDGVYFTPSGTLTYTVTGTDINGCMDTASVEVAVKTSPVVTASSSGGDTICTGNSTTLTGGGAFSYTWSGGINDGVSFIPVSSQTYIVTGTATNGCSDTASIYVVSDACLGISSKEAAAVISVYPNPNNGQFFIDLKESMLITVYNTIGEVVLNNKYAEGRHSVSLAHCDAGIYFIKAIDNGKQQVIKVIKEK